MKAISNINLILVVLFLIFFTEDLSAQFNFYDVTGQSVLSYGDPGEWDDALVWNPCVIKDGDTLRMWYTGADEPVNALITIGKIGYAWSLDGMNWNKDSGNPVIQGNFPWESGKLYSCAVIKEADTFKMWYGAGWWRSPTSYVISPAKKIGYAWSLNGKDWIKYPVPVMELGPASDWDDDLIVPYTVIKEENEYKMWYWAGRYGWPFAVSLGQTGLATSTDGIQWTKYDDPATVNAPYAHSDPVLPIGSALLNQWDAHRAIEPVVIKIDNEYIVFYAGANFDINSGVCRGFATSTDGIHWERSVHNPILLDDNSFAVWGEALYNGSVLFYDNIYHHWFACFHVPPYQFRPQIGYAETTICPPGDVTFNTQELIDNFHIYYPSCTEIGGSVYISGNNITNLSGLSGLTSIGGDLSITSNPLLSSLSGLDNVTSIDGSISIYSNDALTSLSGLDNIDATLIDSLLIYDNNLLSECAVQSICDYLVQTNCTINIHDNAFRCSDSAQIMDVCNGVFIEEMFLEGSLSIFPNPCSGAVHLRYQISEIRNLKFELYSISGVLLKTLNTGAQQPGEYELEIDVSDLPGGLYFLRMQVGDYYVTEKVVVMH